LGSKAVGPMP